MSGFSKACWTGCFSALALIGVKKGVDEYSKMQASLPPPEKVEMQVTDVTQGGEELRSVFTNKTELDYQDDNVKESQVQVLLPRKAQLVSKVDHNLYTFRLQVNGSDRFFLANFYYQHGWNVTISELRD